MNRAEIQEFVDKRAALTVLREKILQRDGEFAKASRFGPIGFFADSIGKQAAAAVHAFFKAGR